MKNRKIPAIIAGVSANAILGFNFIFADMVLDGGVKPLVLLAYQCTICVLALALCIPFIKWMKPLASVRFDLFRKSDKPLWKRLLPLTLMGVCDPLLYYIGTNYAQSPEFGNTGTTYTAVMVALMPVFALFFGAIFLREIPTVLQVVFSVVSVGGVVCYSVLGGMDGSVTVTGVLFLFLTVASGIGYGLISRRVSSEFGAFERTFGCFFAGMVLIDLLAVITYAGTPEELLRPFTDAKLILCLLALGILSSAVEYVAYNYSMTYLPVSQAMLFSGISTVVAAVFGVILIESERQRFTVWSALCILLIIGGVIGAQMFGRKENAPDGHPDKS